MSRIPSPAKALLTAGLMAWSLAGCQVPPETDTDGQASAAAPEQPEAPSQPDPAPLPEPDPPATAALPPEPVIDDDPAQLMGLGAPGVAQLLGAPELKRREPPAEIWQYRGSSCVFDVFLYEDAGLQRVTYLEARDGAAKRVETRGCLNQLLRARLTKPLG